MAGHSKWANIKHQKAKQDAKKGKIFTKLIREITVSAKQSSDIASNPRLRAAVDKALGFNMGRDAIDRAIKRGAGQLHGEHLKDVRYEGYGPAGIAILVDCLTDNLNRTVSEVRPLFKKYGGNLSTAGSVAYLFDWVGLITCSATANEAQLMDLALEHGADDVEMTRAGCFEIKTPGSGFAALKQALDLHQIPLEAAELTWLAQTHLPISPGETAEKLIKLLDALEDLDDVQEVYSNALWDENSLNEIETD